MDNRRYATTAAAAARAMEFRRRQSAIVIGPE
jgi:hypothetical protein